MSEELLQLPQGSGARQSNLALALWSLPKGHRDDALVFYDFCRAVDNIADDPANSDEEKRTALDRWEQAMRDTRGLPQPLQEIIERRQIDRTLLVEIVAGMKMDIVPEYFSTYQDLRLYCWRVACAVGLASAQIFGCQDPKAKVYAEHLGYALQLTNILRDVAEDASLGRIYLPLEDLTRFSVSPTSLLAGKPDGNFRGLMEFEAQRAHELFALARQALPPSDARKLLPAEIMRIVYERILHRMEVDDFRVFERRYRLGKVEKLWIFLSRSFLRPS
ncbi:presqualene diphosphate synthase HpnD [soil metagenome]